MKPIRKYNLAVNLQKDRDKKAVWKSVGEIAVWQTDEGGERLQTQFYSSDINIFTFLEKPKEEYSVPQSDPIDTTPPPQPQGEEIPPENMQF